MSEIENLCDVIIFGGHGDLAFRKLMPALYHLCSDGYLNHQSRIITVTRNTISHKEHIALVETKLKEFLEEGQFDSIKFNNFKEQLQIVRIDFNDPQSYEGLQKLLTVSYAQKYLKVLLFLLHLRLQGPI